MDDPAKVMVAIGFFGTVIVVVRTIGQIIAAHLSRGAGTHALSPVVEERLARIEQAVDAIAIEVERIGEGQRFLTALQSGARAPRAESRASDPSEQR